MARRALEPSRVASRSPAEVGRAMSDQEEDITFINLNIIAKGTVGPNICYLHCKVSALIGGLALHSHHPETVMQLGFLSQAEHKVQVIWAWSRKRKEPTKQRPPHPWHITPQKWNAKP